MIIEPFSKDTFVIVEKSSILVSSDIKIQSEDQYLDAIILFKKLAVERSNWHERKLKNGKSIIRLFDCKGNLIVSGMVHTANAGKLINKIVNHYKN